MDVRIGWAEFDAQATPFHVAVSFAEFDAQGVPFGVCVSWAEFDCQSPVTAAARAPTYSAAPKKKKRHTLTIEDGKFVAQITAGYDSDDEDVILAVLLEVAHHVFR